VNSLAKTFHCVKAGLLLTALAPFGATAWAADFWLCAGETTQVMPDGAVVTMWGFAQDDNGDLSDGCGGAVQVPGPMLTVAHDDVGQVTIHLLNQLSEPVSVVVPGQVTTMTPVRRGDGRVVAFTHETAPGAQGSYSWEQFTPGTFLYHSGSHPAVHVQMGLYGGIKRDAAVDEAYAGIPYDQELVLFYSAIDPALHDAVATGAYGPGGAVTSTMEYAPKYFLVNGAPYDGAAPPPPLAIDGGNRILVRALNASIETHVPTLDGLRWSIVAEDGHAYPFAREQHSMMLAALKTRDAIIELECGAGGATPVPRQHAVYDRRLRLTNAAATPGGMLTFFEITDGDGDVIANICDNCTEVANVDQLDSNGDGYGNICDADLNGDLMVNLADLSILRSAYGATSGDASFIPDADLNGDGIINLGDLAIMRSQYGRAPGPSGLAP